MISFADITAARARIQSQIYLSPLVFSETISRMAGNRVFFKLENLQMTGSFKERGALNRLATLSAEQRNAGVIAASAGNHGMAVAFHCQRLRIPATIVMPARAPIVKATWVRRYGARTVLFGNDYDEAFGEAQRLAADENLTFIHGFNDPYVVAGQGTLGLELAEQNPELDAVIVPVGGGGLIAGTALALKKLHPEIQVIGVQSEKIPAMRAALDKGRVVHLAPAATIADGIAMRSVGELALKLARRYVDDVVTVSEGEIANAVLLLLEIEKTVAEGAAAAPLAALVNGRTAFKDKKIGLIVSGGNIDVNLISRIIEKGLIQDGRLARISVVIPDRPGNLARLTEHLWKEGANILQIEHVRGFGSMAIGETEVQLIVETAGPDQIERIRAALRKEGFQVGSEERRAEG